MIEKLKKEGLKHDVAQLSDHVVGRAAYLKDYFDRNIYELKDGTVNPLIDALQSEDGAAEIGAAAFPGIAAGSVQSQLAGLKGLIDGAAWGVPESCGTEILKDGAVTAQKLAEGAVTEEKLSAKLQSGYQERFYPVSCRKEGTVFLLSGELPAISCTLRFTAPAAYAKGDSLTVNGEGYTLTMTNGKAMPKDAWVGGAVVTLQIDPAGKKAFFSGGGADLSFVTAGAGEIMEGFVGANPEGEPVQGTRTTRLQIFNLNALTLQNHGYGKLYLHVNLTIPPGKFQYLVVSVMYNVFYSGDPKAGTGSDRKGTDYVQAVFDLRNNQLISGQFDDPSTLDNSKPKPRPITSCSYNTVNGQFQLSGHYTYTVYAYNLSVSNRQGAIIAYSL